jgi:integrase
VVREYENSDRFASLAPGMKKYYDRYLREILRTFGQVPFRQLSRRVVIDFVKTGRSAGEQHKVRGVLSVLFQQAMYMGLVDANRSEKLDLKTPPKRSQLWSDANIEAFLAEAALHREAASLRLYFQLCRYTAQRPGDIAAMQWHQYSGQTIKLVQQKTKKLVEVPCHMDLRLELDAAKRDSIYIFASEDGKPLHPTTLATWEREVRRKTGLLDLQIRDHRRTAMVRMAEAGAEITDIAAVSGHTISATQQILETYLPRTKRMAERAISLWEFQKERKT